MEIFVFIFESLLSLADLWKAVGWVGACIGQLLTWGRVDWEAHEWQSILTGGITIAVAIFLVAKCCLAGPVDAESV